MKAAGLLFFAHLLSRQSAGKKRNRKNEQSYGEADKLTQVNHTLILSESPAQAKRYFAYLYFGANHPRLCARTRLHACLIRTRSFLRYSGECLCRQGQISSKQSPNSSGVRLSNPKSNPWVIT